MIEMNNTQNKAQKGNQAIERASQYLPAELANLLRQTTQSKQSKQ